MTNAGDREAQHLLEEKTQEFYSELSTTIYQSVDCTFEDTRFDLVGTEGLSSINFVADLKINQEPRIRLQVSLVLRLSTDKRYLAVLKSEFHVKLFDESAPIFHYDFQNNPRSEIPAAHVNIHASNEPLLRLMKSAGSMNRAKLREKSVRSGHVPQPSELHFPVGGTRFRPCLEDVLQFLIYELGVDRMDGWRQVLDVGRANWREKQLATAVVDNPPIAIRALQSLGLIEADAAEAASTESRSTPRAEFSQY